MTKSVTHLPNGKFAPGVSGNPKGRPPGNAAYRKMMQEFAAKNSKDILNGLYALSMQNARDALEFAKMVFGPERWLKFSPREMLGAMDSAEACTTALDNILVAYSSGEFSIEEFDRLEKLIKHKLEAFGPAEN